MLKPAQPPRPSLLSPAQPSSPSEDAFVLEDGPQRAARIPGRPLSILAGLQPHVPQLLLPVVHHRGCHTLLHHPPQLLQNIGGAAARSSQLACHQSAGHCPAPLRRRVGGVAGAGECRWRRAALRWQVLRWLVLTRPHQASVARYAAGCRPYLRASLLRLHARHQAPAATGTAAVAAQPGRGSLQLALQQRQSLQVGAQLSKGFLLAAQRPLLQLCQVLRLRLRLQQRRCQLWVASRAVHQAHRLQQLGADRPTRQRLLPLPRQLLQRHAHVCSHSR